MVSTKDQEKQALDKIRKIVDGLGENSYVKTAFEGCFEIAEENIHDDSACSMKQRAESAQVQAAYFEKCANHESELREKVEDDVSNLRNKISNMEKKLLNMDEILTVSDILAQRIRDLEAADKTSAERIVRYADEPSSEDFLSARRDNREVSKKLEKVRDLAEKFDRLKGE